MKYSVTSFKDMKIALKELEPFVRNGIHLQKGKPFKKLNGMRPREAWANWLLCAALNEVDKNFKLKFFSDPIGGDGIIRDGITGQTWPTEHVFVLRKSVIDGMDVEELILKAIKKKQAKGGAAYAVGKILIVFLYTDGSNWFPNRVAQNLPSPLLFNQVWVINLQMVKDSAYIYAVTLLDISGRSFPIYLVYVNSDFNSWEVKIYQ